MKNRAVYCYLSWRPFLRGYNHRLEAFGGPDILRAQWPQSHNLKANCLRTGFVYLANNTCVKATLSLSLSISLSLSQGLSPHTSFGIPCSRIRGWMDNQISSMTASMNYDAMNSLATCLCHCSNKL